MTQPGSGPAGARRWAALAGVRRLLAEHPAAGTPTGEPGFRQVSVSGYRVQYYDAGGPEPVLIIAVLGPGQP